MATPVQTERRGEHRTPASGRHTAIKRTPQSVLTPNDDASERASVRRQKRSEALRKSLSDAFGNSSDQQQGCAKPTLSREALDMLLNNCLKLAAENKINDKNVWQLPLIDHLPSIISTGAYSSSSGFNFQKVSGGLDAGVTIYSKRVDTTYKEAFQTLQMGVGTSKEEDGDDGGGEGFDDDEVEDAAAAAAKQAKQGAAAKRRKQDTASEEATLATAEQLKEKKVDNTFAVDPMFHKMSALFDEGGAKGLLLLNRSVYKGSNILTDPHAAPAEQFPVAAAAEPDTLINMQHLQQQLAACHAASSTGSSVLTSGLGQMYALLEQVLKKVPGQQKQQQRAAVDVAAVMAQATRGLPTTAMPARSSNANTAAAAAPGAAGSAAHGTAASDNCMQYDEDSNGSDVAAAASAPNAAENAAADMPGGAVGAGNAAVAAFLAEAAMASPDDDAAAADGSWGDDGGYADGFSDDEGAGHAGFEDNSHGESVQQARRQSGMMGLAGDAQADAVLDAEALEQLLGGSRSSTTAGGGWAGSSYWKYKSAAAAIARLGGGTTAAAKKAAAGSGKSRASQGRIDFENLPELPKDALARGTRKQTCLVTAATPAPTVLPQDLHYRASSLGQLFLKPATIRCIRQHVNSSGVGTTGFADGQHGNAAGSWDDAEAADGDGDCGGDGYSDDGGDGADGYNAGNLSVGDPGYSAAGQGDGDSSAAGWWNPDNELLNAPKRVTGLGVNYNRSAKQVDVRALKDLLWESLTTVNAAAASSSMHTDDAAAEAAADAASAAPTIPFQDVIMSVPEESAAGSIQDVSVHMCFICLLHLANEKGLVIRAKDDLKTLTVSNVNT